jgi:dTDP-4-dehydrorhamnose 3,5-epimerase
VKINFDINESKSIKGIWIFTPTVAKDLRGTIWSSFIQDSVEKKITKGLQFKHDKFSSSKQNVLRGIHGDSKSWKLVTCVYGEVQQVVVDLRKGSTTYLKWQAFTINHENPVMVLIPPEMGNAYYVKSPTAVYHYKLAYKGDYIDADDQFSLKWNDPEIGINWLSKNPILSERDK